MSWHGLLKSCCYSSDFFTRLYLHPFWSLLSLNRMNPLSPKLAAWRYPSSKSSTTAVALPGAWVRSKALSSTTTGLAGRSFKSSEYRAALYLDNKSSTLEYEAENLFSELLVSNPRACSKIYPQCLTSSFENLPALIPNLFQLLTPSDIAIPLVVRVYASSLSWWFKVSPLYPFFPII